MSRRLPVSLILVVAYLISGCSHSQPASMDEVPPGLQFVPSSDARTRAPEAYFAHEWSRINARRRHFGFPAAEGSTRSPRIVGLSLSGGGIRSNAFQMGVLAGLHAQEFQGATLLDRIDYTSSVSGGTWANAAVWAWNRDLGVLFPCLDDAVAGRPADGVCADAVKMLREDQRPLLFSSVGRQRKEEWQRDIEAAHVMQCNVSFIEALTAECASNLESKPYTIFNSTHSEVHGAFPFETTVDATGSVVDAAPFQGFFVNFNQRDVRWERRKFFAARLPGGGKGLLDGARLSMVAAHSSAVIEGPKALRAKLLPFYFQVSRGEAAFPNPHLRRRYVLSDGGKSDNTGAVPLIDRGVDLLIMSLMGKEDEKDPDGDFSDTAEQVRKLFGCELQNVSETAIRPLERLASYQCPVVPGNERHDVLVIQPLPSNRDSFMAHLQERADAGDASARAVLEYLSTIDARKPKADQFPQTRTFQTHYDRQLIHAYYMLGKFAAKTSIAPFLRARLQ